MIFQLFACISILNAEGLASLFKQQKAVARLGATAVFYIYRKSSYLRLVTPTCLGVSQRSRKL